MTQVTLKTGEYEFGEIHLESELSPTGPYEEVIMHSRFVIRLMPAGGVFGVPAGWPEPENILFFFDDFEDASNLFTGLQISSSYSDDEEAHG
ncbi:hypothetical protein F3I27_23695 [Pantoea sp. Bo_2]|uniref:hypothetical protein n=1 Tax=unclassified Pantoea TaxID=2630326 RepID=UPI001232BB1B|nr:MULTISPECIES: hypothetical protein [unclassified Pantoea]KAA5949421.1 hypothetical protein F3I55_22840 [Pantoea sp. VH_24]KAA5955292.1 hypothetical protein F3I53_20190 [Pantoea sp. VH_16]KAA5961353.1 hypothetical protein F3I54_19765 [Pantoea sp. VH_18]KAA5991502.1 hypothetical protein F3I46_22770 [Pantoea sp. M_1]KAA5997549.1 hypothetical protein F3I45_20775 [Pantoea sp. F_7]